MAAWIERETALPVALIEGAGGVFTVAVDGDMVFSKRAAGRFPGEQEIVDLVRRRAAAPGEA